MACRQRVPEGRFTAAELRAIDRDNVRSKSCPSTARSKIDGAEIVDIWAALC